MKTHVLDFGTVTTTDPYRVTGSSWRRRDTYQPHDGRPAAVETLFAAGPEDHSRPHSTYPGNGYNPACSCCWLNFPHTEECHAERAGGS